MDFGLLNILTEVRKERHRQDELKASGKFAYTCQDPQLTSHEKFVILGEEVGEVARGICDGDVANVREELIQVAAICVAWVQCIDAELKA